MPRTARVELAGGVHHVTTRGNRRQMIFLDDRDRRRFLNEFTSVIEQHQWVPLSYCLMDNHVHLVVETPEETLGDGMQSLAGNYAQAFNRRHATSGRLYQDRFWNKPVHSDEQFAQLLRYVALNPVEAGRCPDPAQWPWSNHRELIRGTGTARARIETLLEAWGGEWGTRYARLFETAHPLARWFGAESPWSHRPPLEELLARDDLNEGMRVAHDCGYRLAEIAAAVDLHLSTVGRRISRARAK